MMDAVTQLGAKSNRYQPFACVSIKRPQSRTRKKKRAVVHGLKIEVDTCPLFRKTANL